MIRLIEPDIDYINLRKNSAFRVGGIVVLVKMQFLLCIDVTKVLLDNGASYGEKDKAGFKITAFNK